MPSSQKMGTNRKNQIHVSGKGKVQDSDVKWSSEAWICDNHLKHFSAFFRDGTTVAVHSFVLIMSEEELHYLGYLEDLYETNTGLKKAKVRWLNRDQEVKAVLPQFDVEPGEVFITPDVQAISIDSVDSVVMVLNPDHYKKCFDLLRESLPSWGIYKCCKEFKDNKVQPFDVSNLCGYKDQEILSLLDCHQDLSNKEKVNKSNQEQEDFACENPDGLFTSRTRSGRAYKKLESGGCSGVTNSILDNQMLKNKKNDVNLKFKLPKAPLANKPVRSEACQASFKDDQNIELLCQDSGIRGCWFRCKIMQTSQNRTRVQYCDIQDAEGCGKLEEWVPSRRTAAADKLGMRYAGRLRIRPWPPQTSSNYSFDIGDAVDAWQGDGWWEGVVIGFQVSGNIRVYLPGENKFLSVRRKDLRTSRDWVDNKWIEIKNKSNILDIIPNVNLLSSTSDVESQPDGSRSEDCEIIKSSEPRARGDDKSAREKGLEGLNMKKRLRISDADDSADRDFSNSGGDDARGKGKSVLEDCFVRRPKVGSKSGEDGARGKGKSVLEDCLVSRPKVGRKSGEDSARGKGKLVLEDGFVSRPSVGSKSGEDGARGKGKSVLEDGRPKVGSRRSTLKLN